MLLRTIILVLSAASALSAAVPRGKPCPTTTTPPDGKITATTKQRGNKVAVVGKVLNGAELFGGIPFAQPPTGDLRWAHPLPAEYGAAVDATQLGDICPQDLTYSAIAYNMSEDCLNLNVQRPVGTSPKDKLPVLFWIYGGGFVGGNSAKYTSPYLVNYGAATGRPFVLVTANHRLGYLGWPYGDDFAKNNAGNLGLRDQILALEWARDNIAGFGGDPKKVTVFGLSAGAISVSIMMLDKKQKLFRGAIMQSGPASATGVYRVDEAWQEPYDEFARLAGCAAPVNTTRWACLKALPGPQVWNASIAIHNNLTWMAPYFNAPSIDGEILPDHPYDLIKRGNVANIPFISGTVADEGTVFVFDPLIPKDENGTRQFIKGMFPHGLPDPLLDKIIKMYPNDPAVGSPFGTGNETFGEPPAWKQTTAIFGDMPFESKRRWFHRSANKHGNCNTWSYLWKTKNPTTPAMYGFAHADDVSYMFGQVNVTANYTAEEVEVSEAIMNYWINFAYYLDPNGKDSRRRSNTFEPPPGVDHPNTTAVFPFWPVHSFPKNKDTLLFSPGNITIIQDDYREEQIDTFLLPEMIRPLGQ
ncbi:putative secreted lipase [Vanrija pseudolonga]|uniref:Carboxylic ester hydrolase n=1 Tax=Vanrija pseudolonga TaxID=143232 RepID=A0AAF0Y2P4_9TREE|nr:putative secreted lipase [Vanrija pseudolonga]